MAKIVIDKEKCKGCLLCVSFCPKNLIIKSKKINKNGINYVEFLDENNSCLGCAMCAVICPDCCITVYK
jgi:2-oxoglutarate ferredoxin oxidoreductase subunit delta